MITCAFNKYINITASALTTNQRWQAARWFDENFLGEDRFVFVCGVLLISLIVLLFIVTILGSIKKRKKANRLFHQYADNRGLSSRERFILMDIALKARLRFIESIFTMGDVFDRGATQMIRATLAKHGARRSRHLTIEISMLREKLGFRKRSLISTDLALKPDQPDSRKIPVGRKLYLTSIDTSEFFELESEIIENNELELKVQLTEAIECETGDSLCARYYFGAPIWEFDTTVLRIKDDILVLQHNEHIRYVNRRRFLRVSVNEPAYIAAFPFTRDLSNNKESEQDENDSYESQWETPKFVPADVTELAGPGLRIVAPLEVKVGDRVAVILKLNKNKIQDKQFDFEDNNSISSRIIEDIGIVRHTEVLEKGLSIAVELTTLSDSNISEMVRITNEASINSRNNIKAIQSSNKQKQWEYISETVIN